LSSLASSSAPQQALLVGISQYHLFGKLRATDDVSGMQQALASPTICAYPPERISVLEETAATREAILTSLDELCRQASAPGSRTFFYFSGHGSRDERGASYLVAVDSSKADLAGTAISAQELARRLDRCAGEVTVVLDCCYAGGMADAIARTELDAFSEALRQAMGAQNRVLFAACRPHGQAGISRDAPYGRFTGYFLQGLHGKASTDGTNVTVQQLFNYVQRQVYYWSREAQQVSFIASTEEFYSLTRYPTPIPPQAIFEKDVYLAYDTGDDIVRHWVERNLTPELERAGCSVWDYDTIGELAIDFQEAMVKSKYTVVLLTPGYLRSRFEEVRTAAALMQAVHQRCPRFIPIEREKCSVPPAIGAFTRLDFTDANLMGRKREMERLIKRLKKEPHLR
jgi:Caspase domain/TIR domain